MTRLLSTTTDSMALSVGDSLDSLVGLAPGYWRAQMKGRKWVLRNGAGETLDPDTELGRRRIVLRLNLNHLTAGCWGRIRCAGCGRRVTEVATEPCAECFDARMALTCSDLEEGE